MSGRYSKEKGKRGEREFIEHIKHIFPNAKRSSALQAGKQGTTKEPDILNTGPFWVECKLQQRPNPIKAYLQARDDLEQCKQSYPNNTLDKIPIAYVRQTVSAGEKALPGLVILSVNDFVTLISDCTFVSQDHHSWCNHPDCLD